MLGGVAGNLVTAWFRGSRPAPLDIVPTLYRPTMTDRASVVNVERGPPPSRPSGDTREHEIGTRSPNADGIGPGCRSWLRAPLALFSARLANVTDPALLGSPPAAAAPGFRFSSRQRSTGPNTAHNPLEAH